MIYKIEINNLLTDI